MPNPWIPPELFEEYMKRHFPRPKLSYKARLLIRWHMLTYRIQSFWAKPTNDPWDD